jgi:hypothetical protein
VLYAEEGITYDPATKNYYVPSKLLHVFEGAVTFEGDVPQTLPVDFLPRKYTYTRVGGFVEDTDYVTYESIGLAFPAFKKAWNTNKTQLANKLNSIETKLDQIIAHLGI